MQYKVQMEHWDGLVLEINVNCADFVQKCLQLPDMLTLICSYAHTTSYSYGKRNVTALNTKVSGNYHGLATIDYDGT